MIVTLQTERVRTLDQVRAFVEGSEAVDFMGADRGSVYEFVRRALVRLDYGQLGKSDKGLVRRYLAKVTGRSRAQLTRLVGQHRETGRIEDRRGGAPAHPFERRYTRADIRLLAVVDAAMGQMSGPATRALMRRQYEMFGDGRFERLAGLSNGHLYNLRRSVTCRRRLNLRVPDQSGHAQVLRALQHHPSIHSLPNSDYGSFYLLPSGSSSYWKRLRPSRQGNRFRISRISRSLERFALRSISRTGEFGCGRFTLSFRISRTPGAVTRRAMTFTRRR